MNLMIKMINLIDVITYVTVMTDISALDNSQCHWNSTGNWVTEYVYFLNAAKRQYFVKHNLIYKSFVWTYIY